MFRKIRKKYNDHRNKRANEYRNKHTMDLINELNRPGMMVDTSGYINIANIKYHIEQGANVNAIVNPLWINYVNEEYNKPLIHLAAIIGRLDIVKLLIDHGAVVQKNQFSSIPPNSPIDSFAPEAYYQNYLRIF